jgi:hypothetical protein
MTRTALVTALLLLAGHPLAAQADTTHQLTVGSSVTGQLTRHDARTADGTYAQAWHLKGAPGHLVTVDLASRDFDAFLLARGAGLDSASGPLQNDDSGGHCNARLTVRIPATGECTIVVTTSNRRTVGDFTLAVRSGAIPASLAPCHR